MSEITTLVSSTDALSSSLTNESKITEKALAAVINQAAACGQTSAIFSTELSDTQIQSLKNKGYNVEVRNVSRPQYIISWSN